YPDTALYRRMQAEDRALHHDWDLFDTRHVVFKPQRLTPQELEAGYWRAYRAFYRGGSICKGASSKTGLRPRLRHMASAAAKKKKKSGTLELRCRHVQKPALMRAFLRRCPGRRSIRRTTFNRSR